MDKRDVPDLEHRAIQIGMSLRWNVTKHPALSDVLAEINAAGFPFVEVCGLDSARAAELIGYIERGYVRAQSIHNPCPDGSARDREELVPGDWLAASDPEKRLLALQYAKQTIDFAQACGIRHIVYHLGKVEIPTRDREIAALIRAGGRVTSEYEYLSSTYRRERASQAQLQRDFVRAALDELLRYANGSVILCLENRYRFDQIPTAEDAIEFLTEYAAEPVGYWHDTGHAHTQLYLGLATPDVFTKLMPHVRGTHLHDAIADDDHKAPGSGEIDFTHINAVIPTQSINIMELDPEITVAEAQANYHLLMSMDGSE